LVLLMVLNRLTAECLCGKQANLDSVDEHCCLVAEELYPLPLFVPTCFSSTGMNVGCCKPLHMIRSMS
jgi:hypothetical protein